MNNKGSRSKRTLLGHCLSLRERGARVRLCGLQKCFFKTKKKEKRKRRQASKTFIAFIAYATVTISIHAREGPATRVTPIFRVPLIYIDKDSLYELLNSRAAIYPVCSGHRNKKFSSCHWWSNFCMLLHNNCCSQPITD